ncbi:hypothetical protein QNI19_24180 [Cytophagaceae bacterium DM2B3-1]|uniref:SMI1/KNR4 family protein n=1 Tax=Xanthocytophaga flava TaxID=3048013 RepID=A0ABT7CRB9_9BACT|nr:hypothetical protein [Xanthocytophaga flavus]MDJ1496056.1 hypothetical protein [Xanthocytophaga flavus]
MDKLRLVKILENTPREYYEFVINDKPLVNYFAEVYASWKDYEPTLDESLIGVFNTIHLKEGQRLQVKAFLREEITQTEYCNYLPHLSDWSLTDIQQSLNEDFNGEEVMLYCCPCGDRDCPGIAVKVTIEDDYFIWSFDEENLLQFRFHEQEYRKVFRSYLKEIL